MIDADDHEMNTRFDANGNAVWVHDANGVGWEAGTTAGAYNGYDELNRLIARTDTHGDTTLTSYDKNGNVRTTTDAKSEQTTFVHDARDRKIAMTDRLSGITTWTYDENSNLLALLDAENNAANDDATEYTYDNLNRKTSEAYPGHDPAQTWGQGDYDRKDFAYDAAGRPTFVTDQAANTVEHVYDLAGRLTTRNYRAPATANTPRTTGEP